MKEHPMLFSTPMVKAILNGSKTQTRRIIKSPKLDMYVEDIKFGVTAMTPEGHVSVRGKWMDGQESRYGESFIKFPAQVGDHIWVRETYREYNIYEDGELAIEKHLEYAADPGNEMIPMVDGDGFGIYNKDGSEKFIPWKPSLFMPKRICRIWLEVVSIRAEKLLDISPNDAIAEGIEGWGHNTWKDYLKPSYACTNPIESYLSLWDSINGEGAFSKNPWVWVYTFKRIDHDT